MDDRTDAEKRHASETALALVLGAIAVSAIVLSYPALLTGGVCALVVALWLLFGRA